MPEGHTIHRLARFHRRELAGKALRVESPQGRFAEGAMTLDGVTLLDVSAAGKHLFYDWASGSILHVHLGLIGRFRSVAADGPPPTPATRLTMANESLRVELSGPMICRLVDPGERDEIVAVLGPDPLTRGKRGAGAFAAAMAGRTRPIGAVLLDQGAVAGIGNVYRAELLFITGIHPERAASSLDEEELAALWDAAVAAMRAGVRSGRIVTVDPADVGAARRSSIPKEARLYVYHREGEPCRRCGTAVARTRLGGRWIWFCPNCQPRRR